MIRANSYISKSLITTQRILLFLKLFFGLFEFFYQFYFICINFIRLNKLGSLMI